MKTQQQPNGTAGDGAMNAGQKALKIATIVWLSGAKCTCGWNTGDHEDRCELVGAWDDAVVQVDDAEFQNEETEI